jgi:mono/diheme cytochrome c family protein
MSHVMRTRQVMRVLRWVAGGGAVAALVLSATPITRAADDPPLWTGVFSPEQVARGKEAFEGNCARCHLATLAGSDRGPALKGENFWDHWENETLNTLFVKVRDNMPPNLTGNQLEPQTKLDVVAYLLHSNEFPTGRGELKPDREALDDLQIVKKGALASLPNFTVVQVIGCLSKTPGHGWELTRGSKPAKAPQSTTAGAAAAATDKPLGDERFTLSSVNAFNPEAHTGHKVEARGLIYAAPGDQRLDLTSMQTLGPSCGS